jgi:hypothetical protein
VYGEANNRYSTIARQDQDATYCLLHPQVVQAIEPLLNGRSDDKPIFKHFAFERWIRQHKIQLARSVNLFVVGDLRKYAKQYGSIIQWGLLQQAYILTHVVSGVEWALTNIA